MSSIVLKGSTSGDVTVQAPAVATGTVTMPSATGTLLTTTGDGSSLTGITANDAVAVHLSADQTLTRNVRTKVPFDVEDYDSQGWFDSTTNYRFQPDISGVYFVDASLVHGNGAGADNICIFIYKNGSEVFENEVFQASGRITPLHASGVFSLNGSSDYLEIYTMATSSSGTLTLDVQGFNTTTATQCRMSAMRLT